MSNKPIVAKGKAAKPTIRQGRPMIAEDNDADDLAAFTQRAGMADDGQATKSTIRNLKGKPNG